MKVIMIILSLIVSQLAQSTEKSAHDEHGSHQHSTKHKKHEPPKLSLNQGNKWQMDEHTRKMFHVMEQRSQTNLSPKKLGEQLNQDLQKLINGCTMSGEAHDQLHLFLTPFIPAVKSLSETGSTKSLEEVKLALHNYANYFK